MTLLHFLVHTAAPKTGREDWKKAMVSSATTKSEEKLQTEEELRQACLEKFVRKNKISSSESMQKAWKCGLIFANPANKSLPKAENSEESDKNAARTLKRFMDKRKMWGEFYWVQIPLWVSKKKKIDCHSSYLTNGFLNICISQMQRKKLCTLPVP